MQEKQGCLFVLFAGISAWVWIILACVDIKMCLCGLIGSIFAIIACRVFRRKNIEFKLVIAFVIGVLVAVFTSLAMGIGIIAAILSGIGMIMGVVSVAKVVYEVRK